MHPSTRVGVIEVESLSRIPGDAGVIAPSTPQRDSWEATFKTPSLVMKQGTEVVRDGLLLPHTVNCQTLSADPQYDYQLMES